VGADASRPRWRLRLEKELQHRVEFSGLTQEEWLRILRTRRVTSSNHDTVLAIDWPHFCRASTEACGGVAGWCYTFQGAQANSAHNRHVAMVDVLAREHPELFASQVVKEVDEAVDAGRMPYRNLRYSGSGEVSASYMEGLELVASAGVHLWGFTRDLEVAGLLRSIGAGVIVSVDRTTPGSTISGSRSLGFPLAYTSMDIDDLPPAGTLVTFPVHRVGRVREVAATESLCPKVLYDFYDEQRPPATCQMECQRCHVAVRVRGEA
jgi:hypothetical protein